jgi:hypothetical protein
MPRLIRPITVFTFALLAHVAQAAPAPVMLEELVVTPTGSYSPAQWQAHQQMRATQAAVLLETVVVTPSRVYTVAEWQAREVPLMKAARHWQPQRIQAWLKTVWKHFHHVGTPVEA